MHHREQTDALAQREVARDDGYVTRDIESLATAIEGCTPGRESELTRLLLARVTLDNGPEFQILCDAAGTVWEANHTALSAAGLSRMDIHGKPVWTAGWWQSSQAAQQQLQAGIRRAAQGEIVRHDVEVGGGGDGSRAGQAGQTSQTAPASQATVIALSIRPVRDRAGQTRFLVVAGRDVTEQRRLEQAAEEQRRELADAVDWLHDTLGIAAHDVRNALNLIPMAAMLLTPRSSDEAQELRTIVRVAAADAEILR